MLIRAHKMGAPTPPLTTQTQRGTRRQQGLQKDSFQQQTTAINMLQHASTSGVGSPNLDSALSKMSSCLTLLAGAEALDSAVAQIMREQRKQADQACTSAEGKIQDNYEKMRHQTKEKRLAVERQREELEDKSWWEDVVDVFKKVFDLAATVAGGVASTIACNPAGIVAAALKVSGFIVTEGSDSTAARWTGFGLSTGGAVVGAFSAGGDEAEKGARKVGDALNGIVQGVASYAIGEHEHDALEAKADLQDIRTARRRAQNAVEQEQELLKAYVEAQAKGLQLASKILKTNQNVARLATSEA